NPAFGHSGEAAISNYFIRGNGKEYQSQVSPEEWADLIHFEGNANALRVLTHAFAGKDPSGFALTYATLGAIIKYPCGAIDGHKKGIHHLKKYGFFDSEKHTFEKVATELGVLKDPQQPSAYKRHPLVYLVEAADDICYNIIDLEDAHRLGILRYEQVEQLLLPLCGGGMEGRLQALADLDSRVSLLRAKAINTLIQACSTLFLEEQERILAGQFESALMDAIPENLQSAMREIARISVEKIYNAPSVIQIEVAGYKVMDGLLEEFIPAYLNKDKSPYDRKLLALIPSQFDTNGQSVYMRIRSVLDFVSGMTDLYAVELFRKIKGISFPTLD
ncbi:MAG TPA: dNTP triphosphohydrolase, partial [Sphingobacteriaceae bacterium]|nr:dNTP triphosphohydrolase [Sphingobacteriaceae bacterium]